MSLQRYILEQLSIVLVASVMNHQTLSLGRRLIALMDNVTNLPTSFLELPSNVPAANVMNHQK